MLFFLPLFRGYPHSLMHAMAKRSAHEGSAEGGVASSAPSTSSTADNELTAALNQPSRFPTLSNFPALHAAGMEDGICHHLRIQTNTCWGQDEGDGAVNECCWMKAALSPPVKGGSRYGSVREPFCLDCQPAWKRTRTPSACCFHKNLMRFITLSLTRRTPLRGFFSSFSLTSAMMLS